MMVGERIKEINSRGRILERSLAFLEKCRSTFCVKSLKDTHAQNLIKTVTAKG